MDWTDFVKPSELRFRAVCNDGWSGVKKPLKRRVIKRIASHQDAARLFESVWSMAPDPDHFFYSLSKRPEWSTLVAEAVSDESEWRDLVKGSFEGKLNGLRDRIIAFLEKLLDPKHPITRVTAIAAAGFSTWIVLSAKFVDKVELPIVARLENKDLTMNIVPNLANQELKINFSGTGNDLKIPVVLSVDAKAEPMKLRVVVPGQDDAKGIDVLKGLGDEINRASRSMTLAAATLKDLNGKVASLDGSTLAKGLHEVDESVVALTKQYATQFQAEEDQWPKRLRVAARANLASQDRVVVDVSERSGTAVSVPGFDGEQGVVYQLRVLCVDKIDAGGRQIRYKVVNSQDTQACDGSDTPWSSLKQGVFKFGDAANPGWGLLLSSVTNKLFEGKRARVVFSPAPATAQSVNLPGVAQVVATSESAATP